MTMPLTTTERLLAVAEVIERHPEQYLQSTWYADDNLVAGSPVPVRGRAYRCDTLACIAGWAVAFTPAEYPCPCTDCGTCDWTAAGAEVLGLSTGLAARLFSGSLLATPDEVADMLRRLATLPDEQRTLSDALAVFTTEQLTVLCGQQVPASVVEGDDDDDEDELPDEDDDDDDEYVFDRVVLVGAG